METNNRNVIVLALLIVGVSFFYANLGGSTGAYQRVTPMETQAPQNEIECSSLQAGQTRCLFSNFAGVKSPQGGMVATCNGRNWVIVDSCDSPVERCIQEGSTGSGRGISARCDNRIEPSREA